MSEASCTYTSLYDLLVRHTSVRLSLNNVRSSIMIKNILNPEYYEFMCDCVFKPILALNCWFTSKANKHGL